MAIKIQQRISEISVADNVDLLVKYSIGRCHQLKGNRLHQYAMDLIRPYRLVFLIINNEIEIAFITEIVDYHLLYSRRECDGKKL